MCVNVCCSGVVQDVNKEFLNYPGVGEKLNSIATYVPSISQLSGGLSPTCQSLMS